MGARLQPSHQQGCADIVGKVGDDHRGQAASCRHDESCFINFARIRSMDDKAAVEGFGPIAQAGRKAFVGLNSDQYSDAGFQKCARKPAGSGTDLDHGAAIDGSGGESDPAKKIAVEQEVLTERFARGARCETVQLEAVRASAMRSASDSAAMRLSGLAEPAAAAS